uniref:Uncharacterized protein n=1 Tax=Anguilla anguilla TaxID=7936 RepID=A0A0E9QVN5_ANGAN
MNDKMFLEMFLYVVYDQICIYHCYSILNQIFEFCQSNKMINLHSLLQNVQRLWCFISGGTSLSWAVFSLAIPSAPMMFHILNQ